MRILKLLQSVLGGVTSGLIIFAVAWCYGLDITKRGMDLGYAVLISLLVAVAAGCWINEEGSK